MKVTPVSQRSLSPRAHLPVMVAEHLDRLHAASLPTRRATGSGVTYIVRTWWVADILPAWVEAKCSAFCFSPFLISDSNGFFSSTWWMGSKAPYRWIQIIVLVLRFLSDTCSYSEPICRCSWCFGCLRFNMHNQFSTPLKSQSIYINIIDIEEKKQTLYFL